METTIQNVTIEIMKGDIAHQPDIKAIVNAANAELSTGGGVAGAIHNAAGRRLADEAVPKGPIKPGEAVITDAYELPNEKIIHTLGPVYGKDQPEDELLTKCLQNSLKVAEENNLASVAFPAISTGAFNYPLEEAAEVTMKAVKDELPNLSKVQKIRFVLFSDKDKEAFEFAFNKIIDQHDD